MYLFCYKSSLSYILTSLFLKNRNICRFIFIKMFNVQLNLKCKYLGNINSVRTEVTHK